jgi:integrase
MGSEMASIESRKLADGTKIYRVRFRFDGRNRAVTFDGCDKDDALDFKADVEANPQRALARLEEQNRAASRRPSPTAPGTPTLLEAALAHTESKNTKAQPEHRMKMRRNFTNHLGDDELGAARVDQITTADVQAWCDDLVADGKKYKTIKNLRSDVSTVFKFLVRDGVVVRNPVEGSTIDADPEDVRDAVFLQHWEFDAVAGFLQGEDRVYVELLAGTGMRKGETLPLRVGDLQLSPGAVPAVRVHRARKHGHDGVHRIGQPKTKAGKRTVVIDGELAAMLREHVKGRAPGDALFRGHGNDGTWQRNVWAPAIEASGLPEDRRPRIHDLRHTHASWLLAEGLSLFGVSKRLGHKKMSTTSDLYGHLDQSGDAELARVFGEARARARRAQLHVVN